MMLYKLIPPPSVKATIQLPASKSISNRALIINALGKGIYSPENLSDCDDTQLSPKGKRRLTSWLPELLCASLPPI